jgi:hypothetical protein
MIASSYDTAAEDALEVTWKPLSPALEPFFDKPNAEGLLLHDSYLKSFKTPDAYDPSSPMELYLERELSNPHSRAKKQARWKERIEAQETLRENVIKTELSNLNGRTRGEARREAEWKAREQIQQAEKTRKYDRWVKRGGLANAERTEMRKERKEQRLERKLAALVLTPARNQVIPGSDVDRA